MLEYINMKTKKYRNNCFTFENRWTWFFAPFETFGHCVYCGVLRTLTDPEYTNFCGSTDNSSLACLSLTCLNVPTMDVCSGSLFSLVLMSTVFSSRLRLLTYVSPSDNCIEIEAGIARTLQFPVLKCMCKLVTDCGYPKKTGFRVFGSAEQSIPLSRYNYPRAIHILEDVIVMKI